MKCAFFLSLAAMVLATAAQAATTDYLNINRAYVRSFTSSTYDNGLDADGRCGGISYGTHQESCGTATGGPVGGNANRN